MMGSLRKPLQLDTAARNAPTDHRPVGMIRTLTSLLRQLRAGNGVRRRAHERVASLAGSERLGDAGGAATEGAYLSALTSIRKALEEQIILQRVALIHPEHILKFVSHDIEVSVFIPNASNDLIQKSILRRCGFYESAVLELIRPLISGQSVVVDAGANIGNHTLFFALICGASRVHAFEPQRYVFNILEKNVTLNQLNKVACYNKALGLRAGRASMARPGGSNLGGAMFRVGDAEGDYPVVSIDSLKLRTLDFLKIDVEGAQAEVIGGAADTLARTRAPVLCELRPDRDDVAATTRLLEQLGYTQRQQLNRTNVLFQVPAA